MTTVQSTVNRGTFLCVVAGLSVAGLFMVTACSNTAAPTTTTPTPTTPATLITPNTTALQVGQTQLYSLSSATSATVVTWSSSNSGVLTVDGNGLATAIANGAATITASPDTGTSSTLTVQVVPNYQGSWAGNAQVLGCTDLAGFASAGYCSQVRGSVQRWTLSLAQTGLTLDGTMTKSEGANVLSGSMKGAIGASGDIVSLTGTLAGFASGANLVVTPISWNSFADGGSMAGSWAASVTSQDIPGNATVQWSLTGATQVSASSRRGFP
jgi:hypothetical protein